MDDPSNTADANATDPATYWKIGRAYCPSCHQVKGYVARVDVEDLRCDCGTVCSPGHEDDTAERERR